MAADYDKPRSGADILDESLDLLRPIRDVGHDSLVDVDEEADDPIELPGAGLTGEVLQAQVVPVQSDEFVCSRCFLVEHRSRRVNDVDGSAICRDCA